MLRRIGIAAIALVVVIPALVLGVWGLLLYPDPNDPKNMRYVLWRDLGVPMDLDRATYVFGSDGPHQYRLLGMTKDELRERFGYLTPVEKASSELQYCYRTYRKGKDILYVRRSDIELMFEHDRVVEVTISKGC